MIRFASLLLMVISVQSGEQNPSPTLDRSSIPAELRWLSQIEVRPLLHGRLGAWLTRLAALERTKARLSLFTGLTGIDPWRDLERVTVAGLDARVDQFHLAGVGRFDREKLLTLVRATKGHAASSYQNHPLHHFEIPDVACDFHASIAATDQLLVVGGTLPRTTTVLDVLDQRAPTLEEGLLPTLAAPVGATTLWTIAAHGFTDWQGLLPEVAVLRQVRGIRILLAERGDTLLFSATLIAIDAATGERFASIADGAISLAVLDPRVRTDPALQALASSAKLTRRGARIDLTLELDLPLAEKTWHAQVVEALEHD